MTMQSKPNVFGLPSFIWYFCKVRQIEGCRSAFSPEPGLKQPSIEQAFTLGSLDFVPLCHPVFFTKEQFFIAPFTFQLPLPHFKYIQLHGPGVYSPLLVGANNQIITLRIFFALSYPDNFFSRTDTKSTLYSHPLRVNERPIWTKM